MLACALLSAQPLTRAYPQLVELINRDYADFVRRVRGARGFEGAVRRECARAPEPSRLRAPLFTHRLLLRAV